MCAICGCGAADHNHSHALGDHTHAVGDHAHAVGDHAHVVGDHVHALGGDAHGSPIEFAAGLAAVHIPGWSQERTIRIERSILDKNDALAQANRLRLLAADVFALNFVSSPGSGKTSLLVRTITDLLSRRPIAVIEGDQQTSLDADRIRAAGAPAVQLNTGNGCHLDAHMVSHSLDKLSLIPGSLLFIENVGNLVCPAAFDLGEAHKVVVLSVTEGEDKPLKYPNMFAAADLMLLNKTDLLPHVEFDMQACAAAARRVNPTIDILPVSARTGVGLGAFYEWIEARHASQATSPLGIEPMSLRNIR